MTPREQQAREIETIKERTFKLRLSDADMERIFFKASKVGLTVPELLQNFIGDLIDGTYSNGSDERMYANEWFDRCGFAMFPEDTFLHYLLDWGSVSYFLDDYDTIQDCLEELKDCTSDLEAAQDEQEREAIQEAIDDIKREMQDAQDEMQRYYNEYAEKRESPQEYQEGLSAILAWREEYNKMKGDE